MCKIAIALCALVAVASAGLLPSTEPVPILRQAQDISPEGNFHTSYETANGIAYEEQGNLKTVGQETPVVSQGSSSHTAPDGTVIQLTWVADENGFQPQGAHLPVAPAAPEIPPQIARALEWIAAHPYTEPKQQ